MLMNKRKAGFRAPSVNLKAKLRTKKQRTNTSDAVSVDRLESTSTAGVPSSITTSQQNWTANDITLDIPGSFPVDKVGERSPPEAIENEEELEAVPTVQEKEKESLPKRRRTVRSRYPNIEWKLKYRGGFLDQLMRGKGRGDARKQTHCSDCKGQPLEDEGEGVQRDMAAVFRCKDCFLQDLMCGECCVCRHWNTPFHRLEKWTAPTHEWGLHPPQGVLSPPLDHSYQWHPSSQHTVLRVLQSPGSAYTTAPATAISHQHQKGRISTAITFECLEMLQMQTLTTKASIYDFYRALERLTENAGIFRPASRYRQLLQGMRQWRHLKYLMRAGKGQHAASYDIDTDPETSLTLKCPSCPHPGINLPAGWEKLASGKDGFLYRLCLCLDANFRLKEQVVSSHSRDPALCDGQGYFVGRKRYEEWIEENKKREDSEDEISNCVPFAALAKQTTKFSKGLRYTGVAGVVCSRSDMLVKIGNLNKGERFSVVDYVLGVAMQLWSAVLSLLLCYDISCQYFRRFDQRKRLWPVHILLSPVLAIVVAIGKLHHVGHEQKGHDQFSLNLIHGAGYTDGELCERFWGNHNALSNSTKTMGPGSRQDLLESMFEFWNWEKYKGMGRSLLKRLLDALEAVEKLVSEHEGFSDNIPKELVDRWQREVDAWDNAPWPKEHVLNPYELKDEFLGEAEALKEIALEEEIRIKKGAVRFHKMSPGNFIKASLDLGDRQERLRVLIAERKRDPTVRQETKISDEQSSIRRQIKTLETVRAIYMPGLLQHLDDVDEGENIDDGQAEDIRIWLPSSFEHGDVDRVCVEGLADIEAQLQKGRARDALDGNRDSGRSNATIQGVSSRAKEYAEKYRACREAYYTLSSNDNMSSPEAELPELKPGDVRSYKDPGEIKVGPGRRGIDEWGEEGNETGEGPLASGGEPLLPLNTTVTGPRIVRRGDGVDLIPLNTQEWAFRSTYGTGETRKSLSWIWTHRGLNLNLEDGADDNNELLRAEWCRSRARARRAEEEVRLVGELEDRRIVDTVEEKGIAEGRMAYAVEQAGIQRDLQDKFEALWADETRQGDAQEEEQEMAEESEEEEELIDEDDGYD
ncbi:hypothetical protein V5O48_006852 [Marasmius crinis-equi]|uniref:CxC2-like cysteine cluster KDZ transposase-associated domain-containing protein n=1 Tax=Marasmius crinis-equi TaxID=585013 RepID=A0ABR3FIA7_9AGAR